MTHPLVSEQAVALSIVQNCLVVSVPNDATGDGFEQMRRTVISAAAGSVARGIVFDVSAVRMLDSELLRHLSDTSRMVSLLGKETCFSGFQPGVVAALVGMEADISGVRAFRTLQNALEDMYGDANLLNSLNERRLLEEDDDVFVDIVDDDL